MGIYDDFPLLISSSLGSLESSLLKITAGYASIANGGYRVDPRMIDVIYDKGRAIAVTAEQSLEKLSSSKSLEKPFKRTISRLFELTSKDHKYETRIL